MRTPSSLSSLHANVVRVLVFSIGVLCCSCESSKGVKAQEVISTVESQYGLPYIGFNAKGDLRTAEQVALTDSMLSHIPAEVKSQMVIRVAGGTRSQKTYLRDWDDAKIALWADIQKKHGVRMVFTINGNDTPQNQLHVVRNFMDAGVQFDFLEMMTEYYLPKFRLGRLDRPEVTRKVTVDDYLYEILPEYWEVLDVLELPYYLIFAPVKPHGSEKQRAYFNAWNAAMTEALVGPYIDRDLHAVLHLYKRGPLEYDYGQISRLRDQLPEGRQIGITEAGVLDENKTYAELAPELREHYLGILKQLVAGDYFMDQVLYSNYKNDNTATLHPEFAAQGGLTPKGRMVVDFILEHYNKTPKVEAGD